jgi:serine phosphatase RsbU (regulator of sigma subunit)
LGLIDHPLLDCQEITLPAAATLLTFTDGALDAIDSNNAPFGRCRLVELVEQNLNLPAQAICDVIVNTVTEHQGAMPQFDDVTTLVLRLV